MKLTFNTNAEDSTYWPIGFVTRDKNDKPTLHLSTFGLVIEEEAKLSKDLVLALIDDIMTTTDARIIIDLEDLKLVLK